MSTEHNFKAAPSAISRRLGITQKQLVKLLTSLQVKPEENGALYSVEDIAFALHKLPSEKLVEFREMQKPTGAVREGLYSGKFELLKAFAPASTVITPDASTLPTPSNTKVEFSTSLKNPIDAQHISNQLGISVRRAKEFTSLIGLPQYSVPAKKQKVWEKRDLEAKLAHLSHKESISLTLWRKQYTGGAHLHDQQIAKILKTDVSLIPSIKHHYNLDKTYPVTAGMVQALLVDGNYLNVIEALKKRESKPTTHQRSKNSYKTGKSSYISQSELANKKGLTAHEIKLLVENGSIPRESNGRINREVAEKMSKTVLRKKLNSEKQVNLGQASDLLNVSTTVVKRLLKKFNVNPNSGYASAYGSWVNTYKFADIAKLKDTEDYRRSVSLANQRNNEQEQSTAKLQEIIKAEKLAIEANIHVNIRERDSKPTATTLYVGPTNSGKTYTSLEALFSEYQNDETGEGIFVYAGPLRMLAYEVYEKMVDRFGPDDVGFLTGEEQINPDGRLLACTVEMAPEEGTSLVLDEAHWIVDEDRGQHWTNLLIGGHYQNIHVLTAAEAVDVVSALVSDSEDVTTLTFTRKTPLKFKGKLDLKDVPNRTAVVCFSRKSVYAVAHELEQAGKKVGVLYGKLPLTARKAQIERYVNGDFDIMVTTDVIGHGINLPIDNVVFAQTEKFDGKERRELHTWEVAQIAGRAGRYGLSAEGSVYVLDGRDWFTTNKELVQIGTKCGAGELRTDLIVTEAVVTPRFKDLGVTKQTQLLYALETWEVEATARLKERPIAPSPLNDIKQLLRSVADGQNSPIYPWVAKKNAWRISTEELWQLISGPFDPEGATLQTVSEWLGSRERQHSRLLSQHLVTVMAPLDREVVDPFNKNGDEVSPLEQSIHSVGELKMAHIMFTNLGTLLYSELLEAEERLNEAIISTLHQLISIGLYGSCSKCSEPCSPWFRFCEDCFYERQLAS